MTCQQSFPASSEHSEDLQERYVRALNRYHQVSSLFTKSGTSAASIPIGSTHLVANGSISSSVGGSAGSLVVADELLERLAALALRPPSQDGPPIRSYALRTGMDGGETVVATEDYRAWFCSRYHVPRDEVPRAQDRAAGAARGRGDPAAGSRLGRFKRTTP